MDLRPITPDFAVAPQIEPADVAEAAALGYRSLICNRPDGESFDQTPEAVIRAEAESHGLAFVSIPFTSGSMTQEHVDAFADSLAKLPGPILAYCRSGTRSCMIWALTQAATTPADEIIRAAARGGYDFAGLRPMLESAGR